MLLLQKTLLSSACFPSQNSSIAQKGPRKWPREFVLNQCILFDAITAPNNLLRFEFYTAYSGRAVFVNGTVGKSMSSWALFPLFASLVYTHWADAYGGWVLLRSRLTVEAFPDTVCRLPGIHCNVGTTHWQLHNWGNSISCYQPNNRSQSKHLELLEKVV